MTVRGISNFEKWKRDLTLEQALELLKASKRCDLCPAQDDCDGDAIRCGHPVRDEFGGGVSKEWSCEKSFEHWAHIGAHPVCGYCTKNPLTLIGHKMENNGVNVQYGLLNHYHPGSIFPQSIKINFCPMCGRDLTHDKE